MMNSFYTVIGLVVFYYVHITIFALCDKVFQWLATGWWFSPGTPVFSINKTDHHDIAEILLKVVLNTIISNYHPFSIMYV